MTTKTDKQPTCKQRWAAEKRSEIATLRKLWSAYCAGDEEVPDLGRFEEHGLSFDYVAPNTFRGQRRGYWRYQISWGGPSDEFRFYSRDESGTPQRITYTFMDWFDGEERTLTGTDRALLLDIFQWFDNCGTVEASYREATN